jgi:hypothetical protein
LSIPFKEINSAALTQSQALLREWFPAGRLKGREFVVGNLYGDVGESLSVNVDTGKWADFSTDHRGGDLISLMAATLFHGDQAEAARELGKRLGVMDVGAFGIGSRPAFSEPPTATESAAKPSWHSSAPPDDEPDPRISGWDHVYAYRDEHGRRIRYILRKDAADGGRKRFSQLTYGVLDGVTGWHYRSANEPRCLYGLDRLAAMPGAPVIVCEGEKAADAAQALFPDRPCISWSGGAAAVDRNDWSPLAARRVVIWPDNDEPGQKVAGALVSLLRPLAADLWRLRVDDIYDQDGVGGDAADVTPADPLAWARERIERAPPAGDEAPPEAPPMSEEEIEQLARGPFDMKERTPFAEPVDFFGDEQLGAPVLEQRHVPAALWDFVSDTAVRMGVDPTAVALSALVACASVMDDRWAVQPKRRDYTWTENPRIWGAIVGDPSILKTPVISACTRPIDKLEQAARAEHANQMRRWKQDAATAKKENEPAPPLPKLKRFLVEGTTIEALSEILRTDDDSKFEAACGKVLSRHDEMSEFFGALDRYKSGGSGSGDRGAYLRLYNGGRYTVDRIMRGSFAVTNWSACFLGGIQPGPIQRIAREAADDGLLQRFIYCVPSGQQKGVDQAPNQSAIQRYEQLFPALVALHPAKAAGGDYFPAIVLHADAHFHREEIDALAQAMSAMPDTSGRLKAAFGKWPGLFARLCLVFHLIGVADQRAKGANATIPTVISDATAGMAASFMREIVLPHQLRAEAVMFSTDQTGHARWIAGYILSHGMERVSIRDVVRSYKTLSAPEARRELDAVMASLVSVSWLEPEEPSNPAKGVSAWTVNPIVHSRFAARAKAEAERRAKAKEQIAEAVERFRMSAA